MNKPVQEQLDFKPTFTDKLSFMIDLKDYAKNHTPRQIEYRFDFHKIGLNIHSQGGVRYFLKKKNIPFKRVRASKSYSPIDKNSPKFHKLKKYAPTHTLRQISRKFGYKSTSKLADRLQHYGISWVKANSKEYTKMLAVYSKNHTLGELAKKFCYSSKGAAENALYCRGISYSKNVYDYGGKRKKSFIEKMKEYSPSHNLSQITRTFHFKSINNARTFLDQHVISFIRTGKQKNRHSLAYWDSLLEHAYNDGLNAVLKEFPYKDLHSVIESMKMAHRILQFHNQHTFVGKTKNLIGNVKFYKFMYKYKNHLFVKMAGKYGSVCKKYANYKFFYRQEIDELKKNRGMSKEKIKAKKYDKLVKLINSSSN